MTIVEQIEIGDRVRSFDFENRDVEGERACYVEGVVMGIGPFDFRDCDQYEIAVDRIVFGGDEQTVNPGQCSYPPVNGTRAIGRAQEVTDGVVLLGPMESVESHSALPWYTAKTGNHQGLVNSEKTGENIAVTYNGNGDAEFIAKACNVYDDLLAALEFIVNDVPAPGENAELTAIGYNMACAAIAKAKGE